MKDPLPWDSVPSACFTKEDRVSPVLEALRVKSAHRVATEADFAWIRNEIAFGEQSRATRSASLNEVERRNEKDQLTAKQKMHEHELARHAENAPRAYEITLKDASTPGLPPLLSQHPPSTKVAAESAEEDVSSGLDREVIMNEAQHILADYIDMEERTHDAQFSIDHRSSGTGKGS